VGRGKRLISKAKGMNVEMGEKSKCTRDFDSSREAIDHLVSDLLRAGDSGGSDFGVLTGIKTADFLY
jgi:hypothetical protein